MEFQNSTSTKIAKTLMIKSRAVNASFSVGSIRIDTRVVEKEMDNEQSKDANKTLGIKGLNLYSSHFRRMNN
jgi:hypothetical protein